MQDVKITFRVRVYDDESRVIITEPTMTDSISFSVFTGIIRKLADFQEEWNGYTNPKTENNDTRRGESAHKETERRWV